MAAATSKSAPLIGVAHFSSILLPPVQFAKVAARAGFSRIGLRLNPAFPGAPYYELPVGGSAAGDLKSVLAGEGVEVFDIEFFVIDPSFKASSVEATIAAAANIGARRLSVCGDDADQARLVSNFSDFCGLAGQYGLAVDIENMGWRVIKTFQDSVNLAKASGARNAGVLVDGVHFFRNGGTLASLRTEICWVKHVQLCDVAGPAPVTAEEMVAEARGGRLAPGEGELPLKELVATVASSAAISVEVPLAGSVPPETHLKHLYDNAEGLFGPDR
ncbi:MULTISPECIES: sugar phosphate isomerase/epimerase [Rhizobium]|uniref:sugar phosphate isomerase/epimerase family protein n=1 Tax=Rhizobium TaxID=379 RepID=UPI001B33F58B|nr:MULTISPECIES: sugar phosphate isomerase/epimerase [Rhizobium]MBX4909684.1 sugar phosphate isomerase/epimerase [Rhizobium bangladeshense]MBX5216691.1 sugar phosphate isomerase/epimerase [Rhizobium sp. NLR9a]MBX5234934.1 sugar phosphate isomerase/epimerase [Rhizobium sp. NLR4a]MBX5247178.1 sugar phosphate isomerase/epimerase [Rhizobium sp. NLR3b]MBX5252420.1 sugar phosphate isomerase/epimerase [Rhizobium sp. NLR4b]